VAAVWARISAEGAGPEEVVHRHIREDDEHVRRYMVALDAKFSSTWHYLQGLYLSCAPVMVPHVWVITARGLGTGNRRVI
jgi:hypothetical protein